MLLTAELRLWWPEQPEEVERLFPGPAETRRDIYFLDPSTEEIGFKLRDSGCGAERLEIKQLAATLGTYSFGQAALWVKTSASLHVEAGERVPVSKSRRLRIFQSNGSNLEEVASREGLQRGCEVEFTQVRRDDDARTWWTLGFEAFAPLPEVEGVLTLALERFSPLIPRGCVERSICASYPQWLSKCQEES